MDHTAIAAPRLGPEGRRRPTDRGHHRPHLFRRSSHGDEGCVQGWPGRDLGLEQLHDALAGGVHVGIEALAVRRGRDLHEIAAAAVEARGGSVGVARDEVAVEADEATVAIRLLLGYSSCYPVRFLLVAVARLADGQLGPHLVAVLLYHVGQLVGQELPARRLHVWNAQTDQQVTVIYKVKNESDQPFSEGVVRNYQNGLFIGSDFIELTPLGGEGSVTIGHLQDVRVKREQTQAAIDTGRNWLADQGITVVLISTLGTQDDIDRGIAAGATGGPAGD